MQLRNAQGSGQSHEKQTKSQDDKENDPPGSSDLSSTPTLGGARKKQAVDLHVQLKKKDGQLKSSRSKNKLIKAKLTHRETAAGVLKKENNRLRTLILQTDTEKSHLARQLKSAYHQNQQQVSKRERKFFQVVQKLEMQHSNALASSEMYN
ncbi:hypothetical protein E1B28_005091 [Marasmius oreades]|uniref:Uncharacterized protein n=1 Tax=Marasmius oreades TaxID=181124 RepID=A0A9P7V023_9AGAR|nr:uncharacterized protein E1B28_005091 [Marasmius oreades]KAG7097771.1 hypothetical protein E1B28_005091 [Marasmius oreades]